MNDLVSVIIPVYNVEAQLPRCIDSVLADTGITRRQKEEKQSFHGYFRRNA